MLWWKLIVKKVYVGGMNDDPMPMTPTLHGAAGSVLLSINKRKQVYT
jgi:hypothetical protein